jgi:hypothetical protein
MQIIAFSIFKTASVSGDNLPPFAVSITFTSPSLIMSHDLNKRSIVPEEEKQARERMFSPPHGMCRTQEFHTTTKCHLLVDNEQDAIPQFLISSVPQCRGSIPQEAKAKL